MDKSKIVFCLPGNSYSRVFFDSWLKLSDYLQRGDYVISTAGGSNVSKVRERCVRPFRPGSTHPKEPFFGEIDYNHIMWIDSDIAFEPYHFQRLLNRNLDVVAGLYNATDGNFACDVDTGIPPNDTNPVEVFWAGMGFMLMKRGVLESIEPPWFQTTVVDGKFVNEDVYFCYKAKEAGIKIYVDPEVVVKHLKEQLI